MNAIVSQVNTSYNPYEIRNDFSSNNLEQDNKQKEPKEQILESNKKTENSKITDELSNEEIAALYFNRQATQLTKDLISIYTNSDTSEDETTLRDIHELQKQMNRSEFLDNYSEDTDKSELLDLVNSKNDISTQKAISAYFKYQTNELVDNKIDIYTNNQDTNDSSEISYKDINDISSKNNRNEFIQNYQLDTEKLYA